MAVLVVRVETDDIEACSDWLFQLGATAIEERSTDGELTLVTGFATDDGALHARSVLSERWPCRLEGTGDEAEWRDEWLRFIEPIVVAGYVIHAPWHDPASWPADAVTISIDPGRAFGSGHHPTTRLTLAALANRVDRHTTILDVGCGTGILSIAAAKMQAPSVLGIDLNYDIIEVATANIEANGVTSQITVRTDSISSLDDSFDVVVANIVIGDLLPLIPELVMRAERFMIVSGFLDEQAERVVAAAHATVVDRSSLDGWTCLTLAPL